MSIRLQRWMPRRPSSVGDNGLRAVCVYCASSPGHDPTHRDAADAVGRCLAEAGIEVVYGGGRAGLMGVVADAVLAAGGHVTGVIPTALFQREVVHKGVTELIEVATMHERKQVMFDRSDAFVALPGGFGTFEEVLEIATWGQLGVHTKPIAVVDTAGYWQPLFDLIDGAVQAGFMSAANAQLIARVTEPSRLLGALVSYERPAVTKWMAARQV
jgi:uncharacterized protein (TIGR00730 family)